MNQKIYAGDYNDEYSSLNLINQHVIQSAEFVTKGDAGDGLDPVNELVHQGLTTRVTLVTSSLGSERDDANLESEY